MQKDSAVATLLSDLHAQIDQIGPRGIKDAGGRRYVPHYYKRHLEQAVDEGDAAVVEYVLRYVRKPPSEGFGKLEDADALDLTCEYLVADESKPYASLFSVADRSAARQRLKERRAAIDARSA